MHDPPLPPLRCVGVWFGLGFSRNCLGFYLESDRGGAFFGLLPSWGGRFRFRCVTPLCVFSLWWVALGWGVGFDVFLGGQGVYGCWSPVVQRTGIEGFGPSDASSNLARATMFTWPPLFCGLFWVVAGAARAPFPTHLRR